MKTETVTKKKVITTETRFELGILDLREYLETKGFKFDSSYDLRAFMAIPGGGDWSNTNLEVEPDHPIHIVVTNITTE